MFKIQSPITKDFYLSALAVHILIGGVVYLFRPLSIVYALAIVVFGCIHIVKNQNRNNEVLYWCGYVVCAEVFLRMTKGNIGNEYGKYAVILFVLIGIYYRSFSKNAIPVWIYLLLLIPGVIYSTSALDLETDIRKAIVFNISGPVCLAFSALYCYQRKVTLKQIDGVLQMMSFPIVTMVSYLYLYNPSIRDVVTGTESNFATSGGFGPNQVSTILGLGIFLFFVRTIFYSKSLFLLILNSLLLFIVAFRGIVTFSRGGVITGGIMIVLLLLKLFVLGNSKARTRLVLIFGIAVFGLIGIWSYSSYQTKGLIERRYANENVQGVEKESKLSGREVLIEAELQMFMENPIFGIGVGKNREYRKELTGIEAASHNEISRMLAEHGSLGIAALLVLLLTPTFLAFNNPQHFYLFSFFIFWLLTINHAAMRIAAPAFVYALSLLKVESFEKPAVHRE